MLYKKIVISDDLWQIIRNEMTMFAISKIQSLDKPTIIQNAISIPRDQFIMNVPSFNQFLDQYELKINNLWLSVTKRIGPHLDFSEDSTDYDDYQNKPRTRSLATNWPIFNTENSSTIFYTPRPDHRFIKKGLLGFNENDLDIIDQFTLESPTVMRADVIHSVKVLNDLPRISYSIRYISEPTILFK